MVHSCAPSCGQIGRLLSAALAMNWRMTTGHVFGDDKMAVVGHEQIQHAGHAGRPPPASGHGVGQ